MHISQLYLSTYSPNTLIDGQLQVTHEGATVTLKLSESDRSTIQQICVAAFVADREKIASALLNNTPAFVALPPPEPEGDEAEFVEVSASEEIPF